MQPERTTFGRCIGRASDPLRPGSGSVFGRARTGGPGPGSRLGKVKDISAAALMEDGSPVLILDVDDIVRSIEKLHHWGSLAKVAK